MKHLGKISVITLLLGSFLVGCERSTPINTKSVDKLDLERYMGTWYEIGRYDMAFERGLVGVTANYTLKEDGMVKVINAGYKESLEGKYKETEGKARRRSKSNNGELEVAFFLNFYSDYNVMELAEDYSWALVGSSNVKYLWILSRTPEMDTDILESILRMAANRGYDTSKILWVPQK